MTTPLRSDFDASGLRLLARNSKNAGQARRLLALAAIYEGAKRQEAAKIGGFTLQIVRDWVVKFNGRGPAGLIGGKAPGQASLLGASQRAALAAVVESGPTLAVHGVVRPPVALPPSASQSDRQAAMAIDRSMPLGVADAMDHHVDRHARLGTWVLISGSWYKRNLTASRTGLRSSPSHPDQLHGSAVTMVRHDG